MDYVRNDQFGAMAYFAGRFFPPRGWMVLGGQTLNTQHYIKVYVVFGSKGEDSNTFQVPNVAPLVSNGENLPAIFLIEGEFPENIPDELCFITPEPSENPTYIGLVIPFDGSTPPENWMWCDGRILPMQSELALFALLENRFGGQHSVNFALPNIPGHIICVKGDYPGLS